MMNAGYAIDCKIDTYTEGSYSLSLLFLSFNMKVKY